jgi:methionyl-tRNA synthetase
LAVLRCTHCRIIVDVATSSADRCAACGRRLEPGCAPATIWDDDDPTERRPPDYFEQLARQRR